MNELFKALSLAQSQIKQSELDATNPHFKSRYSTLSAVWDACREALSKNNLCVIQSVEKVENGLFLRTILGHASGQQIQSFCPIMVAQPNPNMQNLGSAISYARRYSLSSMVGITSKEEDDDGQSLVDGPKNTEPHSTTPTQTVYNTSGERLISDAQRKRFYAISRGANLEVEAVKAWLSDKYKISSMDQIPLRLYDEICTKVLVELSVHAPSTEIPF